MCWQCDHPDLGFEDYFQEVRERIRKRGWMVQYVESERTPFAYTIGLHDWGQPELLMTAVSPQRATRLLNTVAGDAIAGKIDHMAAVFQIIADVRRDIAVVFDHQYAHASSIRSRHEGRLRQQA